MVCTAALVGYQGCEDVVHGVPCDESGASELGVRLWVQGAPSEDHLILLRGGLDARVVLNVDRVFL